MAHIQVIDRSGKPGKAGKAASAAGVLALLAGALVVSSSPAARADGDYCGFKVLGAIEKRYIEMGGPTGSLGCPLTGELTNPDGAGRRTQFKNGTIYWSPRSGAWPVWGEIGAYWCGQGCEAGWMRYPTSYEYTVGQETRQNFQCAVIHWQKTSGTTSKTWSDNTCV
ncbi:LGFP repeat-containing protein [Streptomyces sp. NPDC048718]|uniref:LGFP repeat-containing protein n=1 Tax=Streptomyces sp. NPDC048718 TaxID=3365587 RepID=UPI0037105A58